MTTYRSVYFKTYPDEPEVISREMYGRRKWKILRSMTKTQLLNDFIHNRDFGHEIDQRMNKDQILKVLKKYSGFI